MSMYFDDTLASGTISNLLTASTTSSTSYYYPKCDVSINKPEQKERVVTDGDYLIYYDKHGKKTVVKRMDSEDNDYEKALMYAMLKSKGIKPKHIKRLLDDAIDRKAKREERELKNRIKITPNGAEFRY